LFDRFDAVQERLLQNTFANRAEHEAKEVAFEVLAFTDDLHVNIGCAVGIPRKGVVVT
jgi:hypothetical protein